MTDLSLAPNPLNQTFAGFEACESIIGAQVVLQLLCVAFYAAVLLAVHVMRTNDKNIAPFYTIFFYIGINDVVHALAQVFIHVVMNCWKGERTEFLAHCYDVASTLTCILFFCNLIGTAIMSVNRYSATYTSHFKHFSKPIVTLLLTLTFVAAIALSVPAMLVRRDYNPITGTYETLPEALVKTQRFMIIGGMMSKFWTAFIFNYLAYKRISVFIHADKYHRSEQGLLYMVVIHNFLHFMILLFEIGEVLKLDFFIIQFAQRHYLGIFYTLTVSNSFLLVFTSARVRREMVKLFCSKTLFANKVTSSNPQIITVHSKY